MPTSPALDHTGDLTSILDQSADAIAKIDRDWRIVYLNRPARRLLAASGDVVGTNHWDSFPSSQYEGSPWLYHYYRAMDHGIRGEFEHYYPEPLNMWLRVIACPLPDGIVAFFSDVTERHLAEQERLQVDHALRNSEERLRIAAETAQLGTWELDPATGEIACSAICQQNFGRPADSFRRSSELEAIVHPDDRALFQQAMSSGARIEYRVAWPDGSIHWILSSGTVQYSAAGEAARIVGVTMNVTDRHVVAEAMMQAEKLAAVGRLASSIAHEINNPLEAVTNLLYLAQHCSDDRSVREYLTLAERELARVSLISSQTLRFHKQASRPRAVTCEDLFESVMPLHHARIINRRVTVEKRRRTDRPVLCFDGEIRQVLNNLVGNALDAMNGSGGRLLLRSREATDWATGRRGMLLTVADTGGGIPLAAKTRIFEAFFTTKGIGGTGLGLWVSREIADRHAGRLRFRSSQRPGANGTVFSLFLPYDTAIR